MQTKTEENKGLSSRGRTILGVVVKDYILTAEPVGSKGIAGRCCLGLSPATIRNIMAELESDGFLAQPHASAGRIPTEKGFRLYVDSLLELEEPKTSDKDLLKRCSGPGKGVEAVMTETARALSLLTCCAGLAFMPKGGNFVIKHIRLLPMDQASLMVLLVSKVGIVKTKHVRMDRDLSGLDLERISNYLNSIGAGLTLRALRAKIKDEMKKERNLYDELLAEAFKLGNAALKHETGLTADASDVYFEGRGTLLDQPEFKDNVGRLREIFAAFEEKSLLVRILDMSMEEGGVHVYMGSESSVKGFSGLSFVTAPYLVDGEVIGTLGAVGPVRMNYSKVVPLVSYTARLLSRTF